MTEKNLKQKAASGIAWTALQKYSTMGIQFLSGIILARLLTPHDYGCIGMLTIFMLLAEAFIDGGFAAALIQKKNPTQVDYSTIFYWNMGMSVVMYAVLYFSAPAIARFYDIPILCSVLRVQGVILFIYAFNIIQRNQLRKKLNFKVLSIVTIATSIIAFVVTVIMAYRGCGVWSLVSQYIVTAAIPAIVFWLYLRWKPSWVFSWQSFKELFNFGFFIFAINLLNNFSQKIQGLLIGKVYDSNTMGYYSKADSTERLASTSVSHIMSQVTYPLYSAIQDDKERIGSVIKRLTMTLAFVTFPLLFILLLCAKPLFVLLYTEKWLTSVPYFQVLCIAGLAGCLQSVNYLAIPAIGKSKIMFMWTVVKTVVGVGFIAAGLFLFGMKGLLVGVVLNYWFGYIVNICLVSKYIGYKWYQQLKDLLPIALSTSMIALAAFGVGYLLHLNMYLDALVKTSVYLLLYLGWVILFKPKVLEYFLSVIPKRFKFWERAKETV